MGTWTEARTELLKHLLSDSRSAADIAEKLGVSRNAVIGKVLRLGLTLPNAGNRSPNGSVSAQRRSARAVNPLGRKRISRIKPESVAPREVPDELPSMPEPATAVRLLDAAEEHCRYPLGAPSADMLVCGAPPIKDRPYCAYHCRICYEPARELRPRSYHWREAAE